MVNEINCIEIAENWEEMNNKLWDEEFDYNSFKSLAKTTFEILFEHKFDMNISKDLLYLILKIHSFALNPVGGVSDEADAATLVAMEFCQQFSDGWVGVNEIQKSIFVVRAQNGTDCLLDSETFDLTELIENKLNY